MIRPGDRLLLGLSGGKDSMSLVRCSAPTVCLCATNRVRCVDFCKVKPARLVHLVCVTLPACFGCVCAGSCTVFLPSGAPTRSSLTWRAPP
jgi:hypothetical protein